MCSIDKYGNCTNWYCSCPSRVYGIHLKKKWAIYEVEDRPWWNRVIGLFINLYRKPSIYTPPLTVEECNIRKIKTGEMRRRYGLQEDDCEDIIIDL